MSVNAGAIVEYAAGTITRPWWHCYAACIGRIDLFYDPSKPSVAAALEVCRRCGVREACLAEALAEEAGQRQAFGVRGGMTPRQRRKLLG